MVVYRLLINDKIRVEGSLQQVMDGYAKLLHVPAGPLKFGDQIEVLAGSEVLGAWSIQ